MNSFRLKCSESKDARRLFTSCGQGCRRPSRAHHKLLEAHITGGHLIATVGDFVSARRSTEDFGQYQEFNAHPTRLCQSLRHEIIIQ